jgi:hypothetical protein
LGFVEIHEVYQIRFEGSSWVIREPERSSRKQVEAELHIDIFHSLASGPEDSINVAKRERDGKPEGVMVTAKGRAPG